MVQSFSFCHCFFLHLILAVTTGSLEDRGCIVLFSDNTTKQQLNNITLVTPSSLTKYPILGNPNLHSKGVCKGLRSRSESAKDEMYLTFPYQREADTPEFQN